MKRPLILMTERLQIEGIPQVSLIPASGIVIPCSQTNLLQEVGGFGGLCGQHLHAHRNHRK